MATFMTSSAIASAESATDSFFEKIADSFRKLFKKSPTIVNVRSSPEGVNAYQEEIETDDEFVNVSVEQAMILSGEMMNAAKLRAIYNKAEGENKEEVKAADILGSEKSLELLGCSDGKWWENEEICRSFKIDFEGLRAFCTLMHFLVCLDIIFFDNTPRDKDYKIKIGERFLSFYRQARSGFSFQEKQGKILEVLFLETDEMWKFGQTMYSSLERRNHAFSEFKKYFCYHFVFNAENKERGLQDIKLREDILFFPVLVFL